MKVANAEVAQLVEHHLAKVRVAGSNLVFRSEKFHSTENVGWNFLFRFILEFEHPGGGTGRHAGLKILWSKRPYGFDSRPGYNYRTKQKEQLNTVPFLLA